MAVRQSDIREVRYIKRQNLEQEAKILGNMYRDQIHAYGIDCSYYKLDKSIMHTYTNVANDNNILFHAYGYDHCPNYSPELSTHMLVYMEVQNDVFNLNKYGIVPNMDVTFVLDRIEFACKMAPKFGQYSEHQISSEIFHYETLPEFPIAIHNTICQDIQFKAFPSNAICTLSLSADVSAILSNLAPGEHEAPLDIVSKGFAEAKFPIDDDLYKSFMYRIVDNDYLATCFKLKYTVDNTDISSYVVDGSIDGSFLFYDLADLSKYYELLHPDVGDIVTIDFPDGKSREQYEITEAVDKSLATDGINALLHKYVWRCKARRYINSHEDMEHNEANERLEEMLQYDASTKEEITKKISKYTDDQDDVYGGYDNDNAPFYDKQKADVVQSNEPYVPDGILECIMQFGSGSKLATDGYDLLFIHKDGTADKLSLNETQEERKPQTTNHKHLEWLKANDVNIVFNSLNGKSFMLALRELAKPDAQQICLNSLFDLTFTNEPTKNKDGQNFYKFKNCRTLLFATESSLFCHLPIGKTYKLA